jgi:hypothetical protein
VVAEGLGTVCIIEDVSLWEVFWKAPLAEASDLIGKEQACAVAQGTTLDVMEPHGRGVFQEWRALSAARLEVAGDAWADSFSLLEEGQFGIELDSSSEGSKGRALVWLSRKGLRG